MSILTQIVANGSGVCRANSGDLRKQSRKAGAGIARWSFGITPCYAQSIIFKNSKLFEIRKERPTGYTRAVDAQAQDRECEERRDCSDCASTFGGMWRWRRTAEHLTVLFSQNPDSYRDLAVGAPMTYTVLLCLGLFA